MTTQRQISLVWAQARDGVIGKDNTIPWRIPEDVAHFKETTRGLPVVMGRRTWESLPPRFRPLPGRRNIVVTSSPEPIPGADTASSVESALALVDDDVCVMGGAQIYSTAMPFATHLVVTHIDLEVDGDTFAPPVDERWSPVTDTGWLESTEGGTRYRIVRYERA
ncbi:dihydrofolate reductase [Rhodococcus triatomae]|uniref:Dihydrofolate reductase n=1 Tax=Rhodococcus triatomae TaxID=300028 RepID=A0A1G8AHV2_9NOCA|nr:dihydrofolate reductase [Rhodococcus triatomae]QNG17762.1 dihydrofolate reductase [Rhodococcus triatomae]QNG22570.1 dihydrofolate reductase [Rhodococcus triatomae]SDH20542.1 dihydrofolate reductase [Rhodococcus triatomae]